MKMIDDLFIFTAWSSAQIHHSENISLFWEFIWGNNNRLVSGMLILERHGVCVSGEGGRGLLSWGTCINPGQASVSETMNFINLNFITMERGGGRTLCPEMFRRCRRTLAIMSHTIFSQQVIFIFSEFKLNIPLDLPSVYYSHGNFSKQIPIVVEC